MQMSGGLGLERMLVNVVAGVYVSFTQLYCLDFCQHILIVQRQMSVIPEELEQFRLALKQYVDAASSQDGCLQ